jgi:hypothetical protein
MFTYMHILYFNEIHPLCYLISCLVWYHLVTQWKRRVTFLRVLGEYFICYNDYNFPLRVKVSPPYSSPFLSIWLHPCWPLLAMCLPQCFSKCFTFLSESCFLRYPLGLFFPSFIFFL